MFRPHYGTCSECRKEDQLIVVKKGYCQKCNYERNRSNKLGRISRLNTDHGKSYERGNHGEVSRHKRTTSERSYFGTKDQGSDGLPGVSADRHDSENDSESFGLRRTSIRKKTNWKSHYKKKATGEKEVFKEVSEKFEANCFVCGKHLGDLTASNFAHVLPKALNKYPLFKLNPDNIRLLCHDSYSSCHNRWDKEPRSTLTEPMWKKIFDLEAELKSEYLLLKTKT